MEKFLYNISRKVEEGQHLLLNRELPEYDLNTKGLIQLYSENILQVPQAPPTHPPPIVNNNCGT